MMKVNTD